MAARTLETAAPHSGDLVQRIEDELLYMLRHREHNPLTHLLVLLKDEFPEASASDFAQAVGNLMESGGASMTVCESGGCGCGSRCLDLRLSSN